MNQGLNNLNEGLNKYANVMVPSSKQSFSLMYLKQTSK